MKAFDPSQRVLMHASAMSRLRLLALPLTKPPPPSSKAAPAFLLHAQRTPVNKVKLKNDDGSPKKLPPMTRATVWAADNWQKLGQAKEGTWKRRAYVGAQTEAEETYLGPTDEDRVSLEGSCSLSLSCPYRIFAS